MQRASGHQREVRCGCKTLLVGPGTTDKQNEIKSSGPCFLILQFLISLLASNT